MKFTVKLFGPQAQQVGAAEVQVETQPTVGAILEAVAQAHPALQASISVSRLAVNHGYAAPEDVVEATDELALIGMISGG